MKKILITLAAVVMVAGLAACNDSPSQTGGTSAQSSGQSTAQTGAQGGMQADAQTGKEPAQASGQTADQAAGQATDPPAEPAQAADKDKTEDKAADKTTVTLGVTKDAQTIFTPGVDWIKENKGITVTMSLAGSGEEVLRAVRDGGVDAGLGVDLQFMEKFNQQNGTSLVMLAPYPFATGIGLYSSTFDSLDALPEGAKVSIMSDPIYMDRSLRMLRDAGFIVLDPAKDRGFSVLDVTDNPKKIEFIVLDPAQVKDSSQKVDGAIISFGDAMSTGRDPKAFIVRDKDADLYPMGIVVKAGNENSAWAKALADTMLSKPVRARVAEHFIAVYTYFE